MSIDLTPQPKSVVQTIDAKQDSQPQTTTKSENNFLCKKLSEFKNAPWVENLNDLYIKQFLETQGISEESIWPSGGLVGQDSCIVDDYFVFIPEFSEFGCMRIFSYDIAKNILQDSVFGIDSVCANRFGEVTDSYVEYFGVHGDGLSNTEYHGKYYFKTNSQELIEKKNVKVE